jgi:hypothetical protein
MSSCWTMNRYLLSPPNEAILSILVGYVKQIPRRVDVFGFHRFSNHRLTLTMTYGAVLSGSG